MIVYFYLFISKRCNKNLWHKICQLQINFLPLLRHITNIVGLDHFERIFCLQLFCIVWLFPFWKKPFIFVYTGDCHSRHNGPNRLMFVV